MDARAPTIKSTRHSKRLGQDLKVLNIELPLDIYAALKDQADREDRSIANHVRRILRAAVTAGQRENEPR